MPHLTVIYKVITNTSSNKAISTKRTQLDTAVDTSVVVTIERIIGQFYALLIHSVDNITGTRLKIHTDDLSTK